MFDYYSGKLYNSRATNGNESYSVETVLNWKDKKFTVTKNSISEWEKYWDDTAFHLQDYYSEDGYEEPYCATLYRTVVITVPEDYDGLMLYVRKTADDCTIKENDYFTLEAQEKRKEKAEAYMSTDRYLLDPNENGEVIDPDNYYFIRLTDDVIESFSSSH